MASDRWEDADVPGHDGYTLTRDKYTRGQVSIFRDGKMFASPVGYSDSLAEAQAVAARHLDGPPPEPKPPVQAAIPGAVGFIRISVADAERAGLVTKQFADMVGRDTMLEVGQ